MAERQKDCRNSSKRALCKMKDLQQSLQPYVDAPDILPRIIRNGKRTGQLTGKAKADALRQCCDLLESYRSAGDLEGVERGDALQRIRGRIDNFANARHPNHSGRTVGASTTLVQPSWIDPPAPAQGCFVLAVPVVPVLVPVIVTYVHGSADESLAAAPACQPTPYD